MRWLTRRGVCLASGVLSLAVTFPPEIPGQRPQPEPTRASSSTINLASRSLERIRPGTVIGVGPPRGWSNLVLIATPRIPKADLARVPKPAADYSSMLSVTLLANVRRETGDGPARFVLDRVGLGNAIDVDGRKIIATSEETFGKDLGFIGRRVFQENEKRLHSDVRLVARTTTMAIVDASAFVVHRGRHARMVVRHAIVVDPRDGSLTTFAWLLGSDGAGEYTLADPVMQVLPPNFHEDRVLSVDTTKFKLGIPSPDAFAMARMPRGTPLRIGPTLAPLAVLRRFTTESLTGLERQLQRRYVPLARTSLKAR